MYAHEVIKSIEGTFIPNSSSAFGNPMRQIVTEIKNSQNFHFGNASELVKMFKSKKKTDAFSNPHDVDLRLPYPKCWFDFETETMWNNIPDDIREAAERQNYYPAIREGYLIHEIIPQRLISSVNFALCSNDGGTWSFTPVVYYISLGRPIASDPECIKGIVDPPDKGTPTWMSDYDTGGMNMSQIINTMKAIPGNVYPVPMLDPETTAEHIPDEVVAGDMNRLKLIEMAVRLLNCNNIITEVVDRSFKRKVGKKVKKFTSKNKFEYHVLKYTMPKKTKKYINSENTGRKHKVHMCHGFYRHYIDDGISKGMFGRGIFGRFWIADHVRGSKKKGIIVKDYNIVPETVE